MSRLSKDRRIKVGTKAMQDLESFLVEISKNSVKATQKRLILAAIRHVMGNHKAADPLIRSYVSASEERYGEYSDEVLCGLILRSNNSIGWGRLEDSRTVLERVKLISERNSSSHDPLLEGLCDLGVRFQSFNDPKD